MEVLKTHAEFLFKGPNEPEFSANLVLKSTRKTENESPKFAKCQKNILSHLKYFSLHAQKIAVSFNSRIIN